MITKYIITAVGNDLSRRGHTGTLTVMRMYIEQTVEWAGAGTLVEAFLP